MSLYVRARFDVHEGRAEDFEEVVRELRDHAKNEPGTLTYRFFSAGAGSYLVLEEYADSAAAILHPDRVAKLLNRVRECADMAYLEFYGPISPDLQELVASSASVTWFPESWE